MKIVALLVIVMDAKSLKLIRGALIYTTQIYLFIVRFSARE